MSLDTFIRCYFTLGRNDEAVLDAEEASRINPDNSAAKEALATALYANGHFEQALIQFHRVYRSDNTCSFILFDDECILLRMRGSPRFLSWIDRCEETINHFLTNSKIDPGSIIRLKGEDTSNESNSLNPFRHSRQKPSKLRESLLEEKINVMVMGKLNTVRLSSFLLRQPRLFF